MAPDDGVDAMTDESVEVAPEAPKKKRAARSFLVVVLAVKRCAERVLAYGKDIGGDADKRAKALLKEIAEIEALDKEQEDLKLKLAALTTKLNERVKAADEERGKLIKLAEANLPKGDARLKEIKART
jgi:hypothetical protein